MLAQKYLTDDHFYNINSFIVESDEESWNTLVDSIRFDLEQDLYNELSTVESQINYKTFKRFEDAVNGYIKEKKQKNYMKNISLRALKNFLYLMPIIDRYSPSVSIDADTGYVNSTFNTRDRGVFTALITEKKEIHYSRVSKGVKIYKFTGVAKIKDSRDFKHFEKVLEML